MINIYFFLLLKIFDAVARSYKINWRTERTETCDSICFCKDKILKDKVASCEFSSYSWKIFALQYLNQHFKFLKSKSLTFITLIPSGKTRLIFKINVKSKAWKRFAWLLWPTNIFLDVIHSKKENNMKF